MKKIISMLLVLCMVLGMSVSVWAADGRKGFGVIIYDDYMYVETATIKDTDTSLEIVVQSGDTPLVTATWNGSLSEFVGKNIGLNLNYGQSNEDEWSYDAWYPEENLMPTVVYMMVNGAVVDTDTSLVYGPLNADDDNVTAEEWAAIAEAAPKAPGGDIIRAWLRAEKGRIMVDMQNVTFYESVALKVYSGSTLLTTANLNTDEIATGTHGELTGSITVNDIDPSDTWPVDEWTPLDALVPNKIALIVDGTEVDSIDVIYNNNPDYDGTAMTAQEWIDFEGTLAELPTPPTPPVTDNTDDSWYYEEEDESYSVVVRVKFDGVDEELFNEIKVNLLRNGKKYESEELSASKISKKNWRVEFEDLDEDEEWSIALAEELEGYNAEVVNLRGNYWTITLSEVEKAPVVSTDKSNPDTGASDFVGVAMALAVVSSMGAVALSKRK